MAETTAVSSAWRLGSRGDFAILWFDLPDKKQNVLTSDTMRELDDLLDRIPSGVKGLVIASAKDGSFIAGADITEIDHITDATVGREKALAGQRVLSKLASLPIPTVAAINGFCLGGGCELALACKYRVAGIGNKIMLGLPETKLGILPGFGGTQRLPKLVGLISAVGLILSGRLVDARAALKMGLVDRAVAPQLVLDTAVEILKKLPPPARPRLGRVARIMELGLLRGVVLDRALAEAEKKAKGAYPAMSAVIDVLRRTASLPVDASGVSPEGLRIEAEAFGRLVITDVSANLRFLYFLDDAQKKYAPYKSQPLPVRRAAVLGAGVMGGGIGWAFSRSAVPVRIKDIRTEALLSALQSAYGVYRSELKRRKIKPFAVAQGMHRISTGLDYDGFGIADIVIEAVVERMDVKKKALAEVESAVRPSTVIATNTSGLSIDEMARSLKRPENFGGLHFFNPVNRMPLVEIIRGEATSDETVASLFGVARMLGKTAILVQDSPGFLVNRILIPYMLEAARMLEEGASVETVDRVAVRFGMPMGPCRLADEVGLDVGLHVSEHLESSFGNRMAVPEILRRMVKDGLLGRKKGTGFYNHTRGKKGKEEASVNPAVRGYVPGSGGRTNVGENEILDRLFLTMYLEALRCLNDRVVARPEDVEIGMIYGTGFPPFRGGLIRWGASIGREDMVRRTSGLRERHGDRYAHPDVVRP